MRISRLILDATATEPELEIEFPIDVAIVDGDPSELHRIRFALSSLLDGWTDFGRAFLLIEGIEIEITDEMAPLIADRLGGRRDFVDAKVTASVVDPLPPETSAVVAMRAALEIGSSIPATLDVATIDRALGAVDHERDSRRDEVHDQLDATLDRRDEAAEALEEHDTWRVALDEAHRRTVMTRHLAARRLRGRIAARRLEQFEYEEAELLRTAGFTSHAEFVSSAHEASNEFRQANEAAERLMAESTTPPTAESTIASATDQDERAHAADSQTLAARELALRLRRRQLIAATEIGKDEAASVSNCVRRLLLAEQVEVPSGATTEDVVDAATDWLGEVQAGALRTLLNDRARRSAEDLPVLGATPLILDHAFVGMDPVAIRHALSGLDEFIDTVQVVSIGFDEEVSLWAEGHDI